MPLVHCDPPPSVTDAFHRLQMLPPVIMAAAARGASLRDTQRAALTHLGLTHDSRKLASVAEVSKHAL
jgi:hypothetical protein